MIKKVFITRMKQFFKSLERGALTQKRDRRINYELKIVQMVSMLKRKQILLKSTSFNQIKQKAIKVNK